jgi:hypothetical protein
MNAIDQINSLKGRIAYCNEVINAGGLQPWEAKEYSGIIAAHTSEVARLQAIVDEHPDLF